MAIKIKHDLTAAKLVPRSINCLFELSAAKILSLQKTWNPGKGTPVFTVKGNNGPRVDRVDAGLSVRFRAVAFRCHWRTTVSGRSSANKRIALTATHPMHFGVHDHGFNNISSFNGVFAADAGENSIQRIQRDFYELRRKCQGRSRLHDGPRSG